MAIQWDWLPHYPLKWGYRKGKIEKWFEAEIFSKMRKEWWICYHIQDIGLWYRFLDWHIVSPEWELWWIEFKRIEWMTFNIKSFEESQIILLKQLDLRNADIARVYIYSTKYNDYKIFTFTELWNMKNEKWGCKIF